MEYVEGRSLADALRDGERVDAERLATELLDALASVHAAGVVHRDVKPGNVLLDREGRVRLADFGIAQPSDATTLTRTGVVIGTLRYLAPEVAAGAPATPASDLCSAGKVIGEAAEHSGDVAGVRRLVARLTLPEPELRPASAAAALRVLDRADDEPTPPLPPPTAATGENATTPTRFATDATAVHDGDARERPDTARPNAVRRGAARRRPTPLAPPIAWASAGLAALVLVLALALRSSDDGDRSQSTGPGASPAPARTAPLDEQLDALDRTVDDAAR